MKLINLENKKFGRLTCLKYIGRSKYLCECSCGNKKDILSSSLKNGKTKSCGCIRIEKTKERGLRNRKHGDRKTCFYKKFSSIKTRCSNVKAESFKNYGGRGIECEWESYEYFKKDMHSSYLLHVKENGKNNTSLERVYNDGNYSKENCIWATYSEQSRNKRNNRMITYIDKTMCMKDWSIEMSVNYGTLKDRLNRGWDINSAMEIKADNGNRYKKRATIEEFSL